MKKMTLKELMRKATKRARKLGHGMSGRWKNEKPGWHCKCGHVIQEWKSKCDLCGMELIVYFHGFEPKITGNVIEYQCTEKGDHI